MTRMIERWFPSAEVSANSNAGWGSGNTERGLFTWFAARPTAQAKAAVLCSLLPWPEDDDEQRRLQKLVQEALTGRYAAWKEVREEILRANPEGAAMLDPFSGRGMIPLEAARLGLPSTGIEYSPVATLGSHLLTDYPFRDWGGEPELPFGESATHGLYQDRPRLVRDVETVLAEIGRRWTASMRDFYPSIDGRQPWGYLWAVTLPCQECGNRFPLVGSYELRKPSVKKARKGRPAFDDPGQSFYVMGDRQSGDFSVSVHGGPPRHTPTLTNALDATGKKMQGKAATCVHCGHAHGLKTHKRLAGDGMGRDALLLVADIDPSVGKTFREPTASELEAAALAREVLPKEPPFAPGMPAVPDEQIPLNNGATIRPQLYGATTYGDLMCDRQALGFVRLARTVSGVASELASAGVGPEYVKALVAFAAAQIARKLRYSTRGVYLQVMSNGGVKVKDLYSNEGVVNFSYDFFEAGIGTGPGTWDSLMGSSVTTLNALMADARAKCLSTDVSQGSAVSLPMRDDSVQVVVTDPPYDAMVYYSDSSDLFYAWLKRALVSTHPELAFTADLRGVQDKTQEIIVKEHGKAPGEHRDRAHYDAMIARAFAEMRRVVRRDGLVTIVFGSGDPEVWQRLLSAVEQAGLVMTGSWPANTESGGAQGKANIETTLTMACRLAPPNRRSGHKGAVESEIKDEIKRRYPDWERWGLAPADMLMASAGPAMEVVGRYSEVLDARGERVDIYTFLPLARAAVQEAMAVEVDHHPLESFDARTRFALWWVRLYGRQVQAKSELRWQVLASSMDLADVRDLVPDSGKGVRFTEAKRFGRQIGGESAVIDVALALAAVSEEGLPAMGEVLAASGRGEDDAYLWAAVKFLARRLPDSDPDAVAFTRVLRTRERIAGAAGTAIADREQRHRKQRAEDSQLRLL